jgi:2-dehydro-3-deoxyglucarate aldolase
MNLTLQTIPSVLISELLANSKFDGVVLDTEHGYFNNETLFSCIQVVTLLKKTCFVRVTDLNKQLIRMCLDAGVSGIIFSTVEDYKFSTEAISFCQYPKNGGIRGAGLVRDNNWGEFPLGSQKPILIAQIETKKGVDNLDEILKSKFDKYIIGPYDLSSSLGCTAEWENKIYNEYLTKIYSKIPLNKLGAFLPTFNDINIFVNSKKRRPNILIWGMDTDFILNSIKNLKIK